MTTEKDNIEQIEETKVSEEPEVFQETEDTELIEKAAENIEATAEDNKQPESLTREDVEKILEERKTAFDNAQGRAQQYTNQKVQEIQDGAKAQIKEFMNDFSSILDEDQMDVLNQKIADRERLAKEEKINQLIDKMDNPQSQGSNLTPENLEDLDSVVRDTASTLGLTTLDVRKDNRVWEGWSQTMSFSQSVKLANQNLKKIAQTKKVKPEAESSVQRVPPSTQGAPTQPKKAYRSLGDLSKAFSSGQISVEDYRKMKKNV